MVAAEREGLLAWVASVDHKHIGILYMLSSLFFFVDRRDRGAGDSPAARGAELHLVSPETFNQIFTMHGTTMIFLVVMPMLTGLATYVVPLMIGARDMAFPRLNAMSFWLLLFGGILLHFSFLAGGAPNAGWFSYAPLSETPYSSIWHGVDLLGHRRWPASASARWRRAINFDRHDHLTLRAPGMTMRRLPLFVWMMFVNSFLIIVRAAGAQRRAGDAADRSAVQRARFRCRRAAARRSCGSTTSGASGIPRSTS